MACHVLETAIGILDSAEQEQYYYLKTSCRKPEPLPAGGGF